MVFACNSSNEEVETEGSGIQGYPKLYREFKASLDSVIIPFLKQKKTKFKSNIDELIFLLVQELMTWNAEVAPGFQYLLSPVIAT